MTDKITSTAPAHHDAVDHTHEILRRLGYHRDGEFFVHVNRRGAEALHISTIATIVDAALAAAAPAPADHPDMALARQAIDMLLDDDMTKWSSDHTRAAVDALRCHLAPDPTAPAVPLVQQTAPERIWLEISEVPSDADRPFADGPDVTWSRDEALNVTVPYVRADLATHQPGLQDAGQATAAADRDLMIRYKHWRDKFESEHNKGPGPQDVFMAMAATAAPVPPGYSLVPVEPTALMLRACNNGPGGHVLRNDEIWRAMLAAAPKITAPVAGAPVCPQCGMAGQHKMQCSFGDAQRLVLPAVMSATATQPVAQPLSPWIPSHERVPAVGTECVVLLRYSLDRPAFVGIDKWDVQREDPTGMGGPTLETGEGWNDNYESDVIAWFAIPARPPEDWDQRLAGSAGGEG